MCPVEEAASVTPAELRDLAAAVEAVAVRVGAVRGRLVADVGLRDRFPESRGHVATRRSRLRRHSFTLGSGSFRGRPSPGKGTS